VRGTAEPGPQHRRRDRLDDGRRISSLKVGGKEYIAGGGHGAALQMAFHAWHDGAEPSECYNPTQAGSRLDHVGTAPPFHGPSTSALYQLTGTGATVRTTARMAITCSAPTRNPAGTSSSSPRC
jgi:hypothetical protein